MAVHVPLERAQKNSETRLQNLQAFANSARFGHANASPKAVKRNAQKCKCGDDTICDVDSYCSAQESEYIKTSSESQTCASLGAEPVTSSDECWEALKYMMEDECGQNGAYCKFDALRPMYDSTKPKGCYWNTGPGGLRVPYMNYGASELRYKKMYDEGTVCKGGSTKSKSTLEIVETYKGTDITLEGCADACKNYDGFLRNSQRVTAALVRYQDAHIEACRDGHNTDLCRAVKTSEVLRFTKADIRKNMRIGMDVLTRRMIFILNSITETHMESLNSIKIVPNIV